ncbi:hypothetical protein BJ166DRAFT_579460 [Pestalotiopsis sp. NC0098]|nr:hypothetical protein BJ166DRAFT_579460 [Pestalotiopsis sp. NC0098]
MVLKRRGTYAPLWPGSYYEAASGDHKSHDDSDNSLDSPTSSIHNMSRSRRSTGGDDMPGGVPKDVDDEHSSPAKPAAKRTATNEAASKTSTSRPAPQQQKQQPASPTKERVAQQEKPAPKTEAKPQPKTEAKPQPKAAPKPQPKREPEPEPSDDETEKEHEEEHEEEPEQDAQQAQEQGETAHDEEEADVEEHKDAPVEKNKETVPDEKKEPIEQKSKDATADKTKDATADRTKDSTADKTKDVAAKKGNEAEGVNGAAKGKGDMVDGAEPVKGGLSRRGGNTNTADGKDNKEPEPKTEDEQRKAEEARATALALGKFSTKPIAFPLEGDVTDAKAALDTFSLDLSRILIGLMRKPAAPVEIEVMQKNQRIREYNAAIRDRTATRLLPLYNQKNVLQDGLYNAKEADEAKKAGDGPHTIETLWRLPDGEKEAILKSLGMTDAYALVPDGEDLTTSAARTIQLRIAMGLPATYSASG